MLKTILGSIIFTVAVFALINVIGDIMVNPVTAPHPKVAAVKHEAPAPKTVAPDAQQAVASAQPTAIAGDAAAGKNVFRKKCLGCHTIDKGESDRTGPNLWGIIGRAKGSAEGYRYSKPMKNLGGTWSEAEIAAFIAGPRTFLPDTKMTFAGLKKEQDRANIIAYLNTMKD